MGQTTIEWTDATWNPTRGCSRISPGCERCYAERMAARFSGPGEHFQGFARMSKGGPRWTGKVALMEHKLEEPLHWRKPRRVFVNSMSDLFHEKMSFEWVERVFGVMAQAQWHTFQILTKRPERMHSFMRCRHDVFLPPKNVWLGVSVENQEAASTRIPFLLETPAAVRFLSVEPLIEPVDIRPWLSVKPGIGWVIVGCESGIRPRPMADEWARDVKNACVEAGVPFFLKQMMVGKKLKKTPALDGRRWVQFPRKVRRRDSISDRELVSQK